MKRFGPAIAGMGFVLSVACGGTPDEKTNAPPEHAPVLYEMRDDAPPADDDVPTTHGFAGPETSGRGAGGPKLGTCPPACIGSELPR
jgi:hypothetical protein